MKKIIVAIFAHPDDEAFGPCGALLKEVQAGNEVHLMTLTAGEAGNNPDNLPSLKQVRLDEWHSAGRLIGATSMHYLGLRDSHLDNTAMVAAQKNIIGIIRDIISSHTQEVSVEVMTNDLNGITGHIDHIVAARAASYAFYYLKRRNFPLDRIRYACLPPHRLTPLDSEWIFMEQAHPDHDIDEVIDAQEYRETILKIIHTHQTQRHDAAIHLKVAQDDIALSHYIVRT